MSKKTYCTGFQFEPVESCCKVHDNDYGKDGTVSRAEADRKFRECVKSTGRPVMAWFMWAGLRLVGWVRYKGVVMAMIRRCTRSRTMWFGHIKMLLGVAAVALGFLNPSFFPEIKPEYAGYAAMGAAVITYILRSMTRRPLSDLDQTTEDKL